MVEIMFEDHRKPKSIFFEKIIVPFWWTVWLEVPDTCISFYLSRDPQKRPSFLELLDRLRDLQKQYSLQAQMQRNLSADALLKGAVKWASRNASSRNVMEHGTGHCQRPKQAFIDICSVCVLMRKAGYVHLGRLRIQEEELQSGGCTGKGGRCMHGFMYLKASTKLHNAVIFGQEGRTLVKREWLRRPDYFLY